MAKRRLPLLQPAQTDTGEAPRSPWQWVGFGAAAIFATWVPLSILVGAGAARLLARGRDEGTVRRAAIAASIAYVVELSAGAFAGGYLVGRWGPSGVGVRQGALAGLAAAAAIAVVAWASFGPTPGLLLVAATSPAMAAWGARVGVRRRARGGLPPLD